MPLSLPRLSAEDLFDSYYRHRRISRPDKAEFDLGSDDNLCEMHWDLQHGIYRLSPAHSKVVLTPRPREVVWTEARDEVLQNLMLDRLSPKIPVPNGCTSVGSLGRDYAIKEVSRMIREASEGFSRPCFVLRCDISSFYDSIVRDKTLECFLPYIGDEDERYIMESLLLREWHEGIERHSPDMLYEKIPMEKRHRDGVGLPFGGPLFHFAANLLLFDVDKWLWTISSGRYVRYEDDMIVLSSNRPSLEMWLGMLSSKLGEKGLALNGTKTLITSAYKGFSFLGCHFKGGKVYVDNKAVGRMYDEIDCLNGKVSEDNAKPMMDKMMSYKSILSSKRGWKIYQKLESRLDQGWDRFTYRKDGELKLRRRFDPFEKVVMLVGLGKDYLFER